MMRCSLVRAPVCCFYATSKLLRPPRQYRNFWYSRTLASTENHHGDRRGKIYGSLYGPGDAEPDYEVTGKDFDGGGMPNHVWSREEIDDQLSSLYRHKPQKLSDKIMNRLMYGLYRTFNYATGYREGDTSAKSMEWRLIILESIAGVPGFVAAAFRHFRSLRKLQRDHGWIATLLEEAENERTHLLVCMQMFRASWLTRMVVIAAQVTMTPFLMTVYTLNPGAMHRFVAYLEETACLTYASVIAQVERPGTQLHSAWAELPAPEVAKSYWKLPTDAKFVDTLKCMFADECHHRDVNHTLAELGPQDANPFLLQLHLDALRAVALNKDKSTGGPSWGSSTAQQVAVEQDKVMKKQE